MHGLVGIVDVDNDRSAKLGDENVFVRIHHFDEHAVGTVIESGNGGVNDRQGSAQIVRRVREMCLGTKRRVVGTSAAGTSTLTWVPFGCFSWTLT